MKQFLFLSSFLILQSITMGAYASPNEPRNVLELSANPVLVKALYSHTENLLSGVGSVAANGAIANNQGNAETQRWGADLIAAALVTNRDPSTGIAVTLFGAHLQQADGSFGVQNNFQSSSFFIESWARALLLLQQSGNPAYAPFIAKNIQPLERAAQWYVSSGEFEKQDKKCNEFTHRCFLNASALGETAALTGDRQLADLAEQSAQKGLQRQFNEGFFPEKNGFDINYNAASMMFLSRYYMICPNHNVKLMIKNALRKAGEREAQVVSSNGELSFADSTRTGIDQKHNGAGKKGFDTKGIINAFVFAYGITGKQEFESIAQNIATYRGW